MRVYLSPRRWDTLIYTACFRRVCISELEMNFKLGWVRNGWIEEGCFLLVSSLKQASERHRMKKLSQLVKSDKSSVFVAYTITKPFYYAITCSTPASLMHLSYLDCHPAASKTLQISVNHLLSSYHSDDILFHSKMDMVNTTCTWSSSWLSLLASSCIFCLTLFPPSQLASFNLHLVSLAASINLYTPIHHHTTPPPWMKYAAL
jgi:hypothetical protein